MRVNSRIRAVWELSHLASVELPTELLDILDQGWVTGPGGSLLLRGMCGSKWRHNVPPPLDISEYEIEINDVWIPSIGLPSNRDSFLLELTARARMFAVGAIESARGLRSADLLVAVISVGVDDDYLTHGGTVKLFTQRGEVRRRFEDLERFTLEGMAVLLAEDLSG